MRNRISMLILGLAALLFVVGASGGCGSLGRYEEFTYYYPDWTPSGEIICVKNVTTYERQRSWFLGGDTSAAVAQAYYITTMSIAGTNETDVKQITGIGQVAASPLGNYIAYTESNNIKIINTAGTAVNTIACGEAINSLDWGPDETRMAYSGETTNNLFVANVSSGAKTAIASPAYIVSWRSGDNLVYEGSREVYSINPDGTGTFKIISSGAYPQKFSTNEAIYMDGGFDVHRIGLDGVSDVPLFNDYERASLKLSFDGTKIIGGDLYQSRIRGIWVMNIGGTGEQQLK